MIKKMIRINEKDNVATSLDATNIDDIVTVYDKKQNKVQQLVTLMPIPYGNKIALCDIADGTDIIKYGEQIGVATKLIKKGQLVHVHNVRSVNLNIPDGIIGEIIKQMNIHE